MKTNPLINATAAALYIVVIVFFINTLQSPNTPDNNNLLIPMFMLSLLVLSVAIMGLLFVYKPFCLYLDGQKKEALSFFLKTLGIFACYFIVFFIAFLYATMG
jgi:hypothetical protein